MWSIKNPFNTRFESCLFLNAFIAVVLQAFVAVSVVQPNSNCHALDNSSYIHDFSSWIGHAFVYEGKDSDLAIRFCKDVESRAQTGYIDFGRFDNSNYFVAGSGNVNFVQEFSNGDLANCENSYNKMGRTAQVNIICGNCLNGRCKGELGCICSVKYETTCRVIAELAIPCEKRGARVFEGFTVGFHPRSWEVVYNGMTRFGFEKSHHEFSFGTDQTYVALYMTAIASQSNFVQKPSIKISPHGGLEVKLSGSGAIGIPPTTLTPSTLIVDWRCEKISDTPYNVEFFVPVEGYDPIEFTLTKMCEYRQAKRGVATQGWAIFGVLSCIFIVLSTLVCCGGFFYKTRVEQQRGLDALPGITILSACLETMSGGCSYARAEDINSAYAGNQASWKPQSDQESMRTGERKYGAI